MITGVSRRQATTPISITTSRSTCILTPQERGSFFTPANYQIAEKAEAYAELMHNTTNSGFEIAELPFDSPR